MPRKAHGNVLIRIDLCVETWEKKRKRKMIKSIIIKVLKIGLNWPV